MRVLLADDHGLFREGIALALDALFSDLDLTQVESWMSVHTTISQQKQWDLMLLDLFMPSQHGWENELKLLASSLDHPSNICVVSASSEPQHIQLAFRLGAQGYLPKSSHLKEFKKALQKVAAGRTYVPPECWQTEFTQEATQLEPSILSSPVMTRRQKEIINMLAAGKTNKQIAHHLGVAESTIKRHIYNIFQLFSVSNRTAAVDYARQQGILNS